MHITAGHSNHKSMVGWYIALHKRLEFEFVTIQITLICDHVNIE